MTRPAALLFHHLGHAQAALDCALHYHTALRLLTPRDGCMQMGIGFYTAIANTCREQIQQSGSEMIIDCDDNPALALEALKRDWQHLVLRGNRHARARIASIAQRQNATVMARAPKAQDLLWCADIEAAVKALLLTER